MPPVVIPASLRWQNYLDVFATIPFSSMFLNSVLMTIGRAVGQVFFCSLAGYALPGCSSLDGTSCLDCFSPS